MARGLGHRSRNSQRWVLPGYNSWLIPSSSSVLSGGHTFLPVLLPVPRPTESAFVLSSSNCHRIIHSPRGHTVPSLFDVTVCAPTYFSRDRNGGGGIFSYKYLIPPGGGPLKMDRQLPCGFCSDKGREKLSPEKKDTSLFVRRLSGHTRRRHIMGSGEGGAARTMGAL